MRNRYGDSYIYRRLAIARLKKQGDSRPRRTLRLRQMQTRFNRRETAFCIWYTGSLDREFSPWTHFTRSGGDAGE